MPSGPTRPPAPAETIILSVLDRREVVYIATRQGLRPLGPAFRVGIRRPARLAATGKALLAHQPPTAVAALLGDGPLPHGWQHAGDPRGTARRTFADPRTELQRR